MKRPSKIRVLLAVNWWRARHGKAPILRLPKGTRGEACDCPLKHALGVDRVVPYCGLNYEPYYLDHDRALGVEIPLPPVFASFGRAFDAGAYPELEA